MRESGPADTVDCYFLFIGLNIKYLRMSKVKQSSAPAPAKGKFDAKAYAKDGVSEEEVTQIKTAFDLFDTDNGGTIDIKGTHPSK